MSGQGIFFRIKLNSLLVLLYVLTLCEDWLILKQVRLTKSAFLNGFELLKCILIYFYINIIVFCC